MQICFPCTGCRQLLVAEQSEPARQVRCPGCSALVAVPDLQQALPAQVVGPGASEPQTEPMRVATPKFKVVGENAGLVRSEDDEEPALEVELEEIKEDAFVRDKQVMKFGHTLQPNDPVGPTLPDIDDEPILIDSVSVQLVQESPIQPVPQAPLLETANPAPTHTPPDVTSVPSLVEALPLAPPTAISPPRDGAVPPMPRLALVEVNPPAPLDMQLDVPTDRTGPPPLPTTVEHPLTLVETFADLPPLPTTATEIEVDERHLVRDDVPEQVDRPILVDEDREAEEREKLRQQLEKKKTRRRQLKIAGFGLRILWWSLMCLMLASSTYIVMIFFAVLGVVLGALIATSGGYAPPTPESVAPVLGAIGLGILCLLVLHIILYITGGALCCWTPPRAKSRGYMITSLGLFVASLLLFGGIAFLAIADAVTGAGLITATSVLWILILAVLAGLALPAGFVFFLVFVRALAYYLKERSTGDEVGPVVTNSIVLFVLLFPVVVFNFMYWSYGAISCIGVFFEMLWLYYWLKNWFRLFNAVGTVRATMENELLK